MVFLFVPRTYVTGDSLRYLTPFDTVLLEIGPYGEKYGFHYVERKQTLFSLARFYGLSLQEVYQYNPQYRERAPTLGEPVRYPIPNRAIIRYLRPGLDLRQLHAPIFYRVKKGDTLYRLAKIYFRIPIETLLERAGLQSHTDLKPGQLIFIGWLPLGGIQAELQAQNTLSPVAWDNKGLARNFGLLVSSGKKVSEEKGPAVWKEDPKSPKGFFALHRTAPKNAVLEVLNPMLNRKVYVKVVGKLASQAYDEEVVVVLSQQAAKTLGAIDPRFFVHIRYTK
jgi:hypothetical protein